MPPTYEQLLADDAEWALREGSSHFDRKSAVHGALRTIAERLGELQIPYAVAFPDPAGDFVEIQGIRCLSLRKIIELKLASGMTNRGRMRDLSDVQDVNRVLHLPLDLAEQLDPFVRDTFVELWNGVRADQVEP